MKKPNEKDIAAPFHKYLDLAPDDNLLENLQANNDDFVKLLKGISKEQETYQYQSDKWNIKQIICHLTNSESYFCGLVIRITKEDSPKVLTYPYGKYEMEVNSKKGLVEIIKDFSERRKATIQFFQIFDSDLAYRVQIINGNNYSPVGVGYIILGHEIHHVNTIKEKYLK
jgi:DinB superfamily